jgi:type IV pilus assembly protein PilQ
MNRGTKISIDFNEVPWEEAFLSIMRSQMLTYVWEGDIIRVVTMKDMENELKMESFREQRRAQEILRMKLSPLHTRVFPIDYADAAKLKASLEAFLTKDEKGSPYGSIQVNEHTNALIVQATENDLGRIVPMIEEIDRPTSQIRIEANIVETTRETARSLGIQWGGNYSNIVSGKTYQITGASSLSENNIAVDFPIGSTTIEEAGGLAALGFTFGIGDNILDLQLQALQTQGKLNILSSPSITTLDNQTAFTENGEKVPYVTINEDSDQEVAFEDAVLRLEITPHVIGGSNLKMKIVINKDEVDTTRDVQGNPFIIKKRTDTTLIVKNGETIVISGLSKTRESKGDQGIPGLKDIPVLGWLFKGEDRTSKLEEVLIFITPRILETEVIEGSS